MKFYLRKIQINIKLIPVHFFNFLFFFGFYFGFFIITKTFAQSPIKPAEIPSAGMPNNPSAGMPLGGMPNNPSAGIPSAGMPNNPSAGMPLGGMPNNPAAGMPLGGMPNNPAAGIPLGGMPNNPSAGMPLGGMPNNPAAGMPNGPLPSMPGGMQNPMGIQNNTLGQISGASISNSISKILGDAGEPNITVLMFNDQEEANINRAIDSLKNNQIYVPEGLEKQEEKVVEEDPEKKEENEIEENEKSYIYLSSVIYFSANDWVIWLNDQKISTSTNNEQKEIYVSNADKDRIKIRWKMSLTKWKILSGKKDETLAPRLDFDSNTVESEFELRPNQTYILGSNSVVEGKAVIALIKKKESKEKSSAKKSETTKTINDSIDQNNPIAKGGNILSTIKNLQQMNQQLDENKEQIR